MNKKGMQIKHKLNMIFVVLGLLLDLTGIFMVAVGTSTLFPSFQYPDLLPWGMIILGIAFIICGAMEWVTDKLPPIDPAKAKEVEIEEKDERNITIANMAKARTYERMSVLFAFALCLLGVLGYLPHVSFFTFLGVFLISQLYFIYQLWMLHKTM